jgi:hypothetical protein
MRLPNLLPGVMRLGWLQMSSVFSDGMLPLGGNNQRQLTWLDTATSMTKTYAADQINEDFRGHGDGEDARNYGRNCNGNNDRYWCPCFLADGGTGTFNDQYACCPFSNNPQSPSRCDCTNTTNVCSAFTP